MLVELEINGIIIVLSCIHTIIMACMRLVYPQQDNSISFSLIFVSLMFAIMHSFMMTKSKLYSKSERYVEYAFIAKGAVLSFCFLYLLPHYFSFGIRETWSLTISRFNSIVYLLSPDTSYLIFSLAISLLCGCITMLIVKVAFRYGYYYYFRLVLSSAEYKLAIKPIVSIFSALFFVASFCPAFIGSQLNIHGYNVFGVVQFLLFAAFIYTTTSMRREELAFHFKSSQGLYNILSETENIDEKQKKSLIRKINRLSNSTWMSIYQSIALMIIAISLGLLFLNKCDYVINRTAAQQFDFSFLYKDSPVTDANVQSSKSREPLSINNILLMLGEIHKKGVVPGGLYIDVGVYISMWTAFTWSLILLLSMVYYRSYRKTRRIRPSKAKIY